MRLIHVLVKYLLCLVNLFFTIIAIGIVVLGVIILKQYKEFGEQELDDDVEMEAVIKKLLVSIIVFGSVVFFISFSGCCGAVTETKFLLVTYAVLMVFIFTAKIYLLVVWNRDINMIRSETNKTLTNLFNDSNTNSTFHLIEASLQCCGTTGPSSYTTLPLTCCSEDVLNLEHECLYKDAFSIGCLELVENYIDDIEKAMKFILFVAIGIEALEIIAAIYLCNSINKYRSDPKYYN